MNNNSSDISREEGNKLISYFMMEAKCFPENCHKVEDLKYHSSWDWLLPVWEKFRVWCWKNIGYNSDFEKHKEKFMSGVFNNNCQQSCEARQRM